jgi:hypothetical protein
VGKERVGRKSFSYFHLKNTNLSLGILREFLFFTFRHYTNRVIQKSLGRGQHFKIVVDGVSVFFQARAVLGKI